jgi:hypothetical protein
MPDPTEPYSELLPIEPYTSLRSRIKQFISARFVEVRNLAYVHYKDQDGKPLLSHQETMTLDRTRVMAIILHKENRFGAFNGAQYEPLSTLEDRVKLELELFQLDSRVKTLSVELERLKLRSSLGGKRK